MAGVGKFKLTDALPKSVGESTSTSETGARSKAGSGGRSKKAGKGKTAGTQEASSRGHTGDIGRGNQQSGRQKAK